ncbi:CDP-diacylglycerol--glycerol-3-phosphate 3-phosphatidyltransferase [Nitrosophilus labii]|uniref:CDP-diacylglycerol--glycerol-3-phosphate 3-phosphatidyltransferase n=1 Tax=Nitrosophilus labii TaxID=2706014 RepID=UPI001656CECD|nr:CDP-diacylglycerol--glycerol-3-phosphate 3-phosphatidyltransferase [Nitrosophilus labii]
MLNIPNILAFIRLLIAPIMFMFLVNRELFPNIHPTWLDFFAAFLFVLASITDFFDGFIARNFDQITQLGKILDPLADKMLTLAGFLGLMMLGRADPWAIYLILTREFFITGLRVAAVSEGKEVAASFLGKIKTIIQMIAIGFLIMNWPFGTLILWIAVGVTLYSGYEYIKEYLK